MRKTKEVTMTTREVADMVNEMLTRGVCATHDEFRAWLRERANNIAQALAGVRVMP